MKISSNYPVKVLATGFIVLTLISILLFWFKFVCYALIYETTSKNDFSLEEKPSGLLLYNIEYDSNTVSKSKVNATMRPHNFLSFGIINYAKETLPGGNKSEVYFFKSDKNMMYFDKSINQIVCKYTFMEKTHNKKYENKEAHLFIGPEGVSEMPDQNIGQFEDPIIDRDGFPWINNEPRTLILYDKSLCRFFKINLDEKTIIKGPEIKKDFPYRPVQIGQLGKNLNYLSQMGWTSPILKFPCKEENNQFNSLYTIELWYYKYLDGPYLLVLDESGRIDLLDRATLDLAGIAGWLPKPVHHHPTQIEPKHLLCYNVTPLFIWPDISEDSFESEYKRKKESIELAKSDTLGQAESKSVYSGKYLEEIQEKTDEVLKERSRYEYGGLINTWGYGQPGRTTENNKYLTFDLFYHLNKKNREYAYKGIMATSLSKDGTVMSLVVFDEKGDTTIRHEIYGLFYKSRYSRYSKAIALDIPWLSSLVIGEYSLENIHPLILSVLTYFTADSFEAGSGYRALFILPNSFIAMLARDASKNIVGKIIIAFQMLLPSILLSLFFSWRIIKDATKVGLSKKARFFWIVGTIPFGIVAYITYRLTRPKITLVTCQNCGKPRRPDMDLCHRCNSKWDVPELTPPAWCVVDK